MGIVILVAILLFIMMIKLFIDKDYVGLIVFFFTIFLVFAAGHNSK